MEPAQPLAASIGVLLTWAYFAALWVPGALLLRRLAWLEPASGALGWIARGYAATLLLLSPLSIACYVLGAPLFVFSIGSALLVAASVVLSLRERSLRAWLDAASSALRADATPLRALLVALVLGVLLMLQARVGGHLTGDAQVHLGHVRYFLQHGFSNRDIYLRDLHFQHVYHTNLLYALYASAAQLTGRDYLDTWFALEPWAKLCIAAGHYTLGYTLSRRRWVGSLLAAIALTVAAGENYALYPNTLAVGFLLPLALSAGFHLVRPIDDAASTSARPGQRQARHACIELAAISFVLGQVHSLYALYAGLLLGPLLLFVVLRRLAKRQRVALLLWGGLGLLAGAPFTLISAFAFQGDAPTPETQPETQQDTQPDQDTPAPATASVASSSRAHAGPGVRLSKAKTAAAAAGGGHLEKELVRLPDGRLVFTAGQMGGPVFLLLGLLALGALVLVDRPSRSSWLAVLCVALVLCLVLLSPQGCALAMRALRTQFAVARLSTVLGTLLFAGLAAAIMVLAELAPKPQLVQPLAFALCVLAATRLLGYAPISFADHVALAFAPESVRYAELQADKQRRSLLQHVKPGAVVLTTDRAAHKLIMVCDCFVIAADRGHTHLNDLAQRRAALAALNDARTPQLTRDALLQRYAVSYVLYEDRRRRQYRWADLSGTLVGRAAGFSLLRLDGRQ